MASPPKPWEQPGAATTAAAASVSPSTATSTTDPSAPPLPNRPSSLTSTVNQNAANYSRMATSPYSSMGGAYSSPYSSPYSRFGMGGYGGGMYGGYGGYGGGMYGGMGGGMYGGMGGGMGMPGDPNSLTNSFNNSTQATFQMLEGIVTAFGGFAQMLESTYMATHSSFFAMVSVAEQFGNLRDTLGSVLGIFTLLRWIRTLIAKITGRPPPADAMALTPAAFARFEGRSMGPDGKPLPPKASKKPLLFFVLAAFGIPYLMSKMIKSLAASQEEEQRRLQAQALESQQPMDPSKLEFCRLTYDFLPQPNTGMELEARKGDLVAVLSKNDPSGNPSEWWQCRSRDGRQGYLPSTYLEVLKRPTQEPKKLKAAPSESSRTNSLTSSIERPEEGKKEYATADGMQRSHFYS
ncbi:Peroxin 13, N-terminal region-domain-containing protein [Fusarium solani]|uniref:Peroxisomal membrane protein PEX13 n=1 Tax=Fusarium solani TaxID=169388 RepID=A0A9P9L2R0_FUSSL|nr:Peroxin 13, N-terminal region-domain-containing protein [Fusarium solani]KAH7273600.1 Peroxin 13, N-terminal region-domain-containing protein [Fusarium solani]